MLWKMQNQIWVFISESKKSKLCEKENKSMFWKVIRVFVAITCQWISLMAFTSAQSGTDTRGLRWVVVFLRFEPNFSRILKFINKKIEIFKNCKFFQKFWKLILEFRKLSQEFWSFFQNFDFVLETLNFSTTLMRHAKSHRHWRLNYKILNSCLKHKKV